jgi:hypothetical protein
MMLFALLMTGGALASLFVLPWQVAALLALIAAPFLPLAPVAVGLLADTLYLAPSASLHTLPVWTIAGIAVAVIALFVRRNVEARIMTS